MSIDPIDKFFVPRRENFEITRYGQALEDLEVALVTAWPGYMDIDAAKREYLLLALVAVRGEVARALATAGEEVLKAS